MNQSPKISESLHEYVGFMMSEDGKTPEEARAYLRGKGLSFTEVEEVMAKAGQWAREQNIRAGKNQMAVGVALMIFGLAFSVVLHFMKYENKPVSWGFSFFSVSFGLRTFLKGLKKRNEAMGKG